MKPQGTVTTSSELRRGLRFMFPAFMIMIGFVAVEHLAVLSFLFLKPEQIYHDHPYDERHIGVGVAKALPSILVSTEDSEKVKKGVVYGGKGDQSHLGGFVELDRNGLSPGVWRVMMEEIGIKSILDVGCGRGISTSFFHLQGIDTACVEGSHDAVVNTVIPKDGTIVEHDFSRGPWWPSKTVDAVWCIEFIEHVGRNHHRNIFASFEKAAMVFVTHSNWGGWHHVEIHEDAWWRTKFELRGFVYSQYLTTKIRNAALKGMGETLPNGDNFQAQHISLTMMVFINPAVSSLPAHDHLLSEHGCGKSRRGQPGKKCGQNEETPLPEHYLPLKFDEEKFELWKSLVMDTKNITRT